MEFGEQLPCGGYAQQDKIIKNNMKLITQQSNTSEQALNSNSKNCCNTSSQCCKSQSCCKNKKQPKIETCDDCQCESKQPKIQQQITKKKTSVIALCKKCKKQPSALMHKNEPICKDCLFKNIEYKCRLTLENSMKVQGNSSILLCFSGGLNSICLVNVMASLKKRYQKHHLFGKLTCIHIKQQQKLPDNYKQTFESQTGLPLQILSIEQVFEGENKSLNDVKQLFKMFDKSANTADLLALMRDRLILDYAKKNGYEFIIKALNGQSIAGSIFKYFTKGIGGQITELSSREPDSLFHFPLRQHLQKQLQFYFYTLKLNKISLISEQDDLSNHCSQDLDDYLNNFILNLQTMYSHTAPAITRTGQKIQSKRKSDLRCQWCSLKNAFPLHNLCRKCDRIYENKNGKFQNNKVPQWMKITQ